MLDPVVVIVFVAVIGLVLVIGKIFQSRRAPTAEPATQKQSRGQVARSFRSMWNTHQDGVEQLEYTLENRINQRMLTAAEAEGNALRQKFEAFVKSIEQDQTGGSPAGAAQNLPQPPVAPAAPALEARAVGETIRSRPGS